LISSSVRTGGGGGGCGFGVVASAIALAVNARCVIEPLVATAAIVICIN